MKAIQVKYLSATNHKPSRWKAFAEGGHSITKSYSYDATDEGNARAVAEALIAKAGWDCRITGCGTLPNQDYVFTIGG